MKILTVLTAVFAFVTANKLDNGIEVHCPTGGELRRGETRRGYCLTIEYGTNTHAWLLPNRPYIFFDVHGPPIEEWTVITSYAMI